MEENFDAYKSDYEIEYDERVDLIRHMIKQGFLPNDVESILDMDYRIQEYGRKIQDYMSDGPGHAGPLYFIPFGDPGIVGYYAKTKNGIVTIFDGELPTKREED